MQTLDTLKVPVSVRILWYDYRRLCTLAGGPERGRLSALLRPLVSDALDRAEAGELDHILDNGKGVGDGRDQE
jgi:hypothetical protein